MKFDLRIALPLLAACACFPAWAGWAGMRADDSAAIRSTTIQTNKSSDPDFLQTGLMPIRPASSVDNPDLACGDVFQNRTGLTITVTIVPAGSKDRYAHLFVMRDPPAGGWVHMAYSQNNIPVSVMVPNGALYCPTSNGGGQYYVTVVGASRYAALFGVDYRLWSDAPAQGYFGSYNGTCIAAAIERTFYRDGVATGIHSYYSIYYQGPLNPVRQGACPDGSYLSPPQDNREGDGAQ